MYELFYRVGFRPWERYVAAAGEQIAAKLAREESKRPIPPGRALDVGCGRGLYTNLLAERGWDAVGIDAVPRAIEAARRDASSSARFVVADVTDLPLAQLGRFGFSLDVGCLQALRPDARPAAAQQVTAVAEVGATLLILAFQPTGVLSRAGSATRDEIEAAFSGWTLLGAEPAETKGLGWPLTRTAPMWYRLRLRR